MHMNKMDEELYSTKFEVSQMSAMIGDKDEGLEVLWMRS